MATPAPAVAELVLSGRAHAAVWLRAGLGLLVGAAIAAACGFGIVALVLSSLAVTPIVVGLVLAAVARGHERAAAALLAGEAALRWICPAAQWHAHVAAERAAAKSFGWLFVGLGMLSGGGAAMAMADDGDRIAGSQELTWVLPPLAGALLGLGVTAVVRVHQRAHFDRMERSPGVFCLGANGMYLTGSYWPWDGVGVSVRGVAIEGGALVFQFAIGDAEKAVRVPIAPGHEADAQRYVDRVHGR